MAIAMGEVPARHWFRLGREVTPVGRGAALVSWSGSMFEYLMPSLVMRAPLGSLIEKTNSLIVRRHIDYATSRGVPWGISESAYNARDKELTYQYSNFGVPGLGFKRGLGEDVVIAPYATALAAMVDPAAAAANFTRLAGIGGLGHYGFYEALDFTPSRLPDGQARAVVRAYMAHHQGMTIVALANALLDGVMRTPLPRRADDPGDRAPVAGTHAARRRRRPSAHRGGWCQRHGGGPRACRRAPPAQPACGQPVRASAVQRPLFGDADGRRLGLQPLGRARRHALARGHDARRLGQLCPAARCRQRRGVVGRLAAARHAARQL